MTCSKRIGLLLLLAAPVLAQSQQNVFKDVPDEPGLPRVLLIGDSISMGYTQPVRALLAGKANVHRIPENGGPTSRGVEKLDQWLGTGHWDVIHFNFGLHDLRIMETGTYQVSLADYEANLRKIVARLKATGARLIWATTTPVPDAKLSPPRRSADVPLFNRAALKIMQENGVVIDDLFALAEPQLASIQRPANVHYTNAGYEVLARQVAASILKQLESPRPRKYGYGSPDVLKWVDPDHSDAGNLKFKTFYSNTVKQDVSYMIYLPPDYEQNKEARYPVLYQLPASGGTPRRDGPQVTVRIDKAIRAHRIAPMILVTVNGLGGNTMYCDTRDGLYPLETVIIKDLIPHIDATYRTIASREGRGVNGFSMGGFGAAHLGFKYPDVFGVDSIMAPPLIEPGLTGLPAQAWSRLFPSAMDSDMEYWKGNDPFELAARNADKLRDRTFIRIVAHDESGHWLAPQCEKLHKILAEHMVQHEYCLLLNVKAHNPVWCMDTLGDAAFSFFSSSVMTQKPGQHPGGAGPGRMPPSGKARPPQAPANAPAVGQDGWEHLPDGSSGKAAEFRGVGGTPITAYIRKPAGSGPFPVIVWMHGGRDSRQATIAMGRSQRSPFEDVVKQGWAIYSADYRHEEKIGIYPIEFEDTVKAVETARALPFVDPRRVGYMGQSHGAQVGTRVISRVDLSGAVIMAPAAMDFIEIKRAMKAGVKLVPILSTMLADLERQYGAPMEEIAKNPAKYGYSSGITEAGRVRCPVLVENARDDDNSPPSVVDAWIKALRAAGKQVERYEPDHGGHGFYFRDLPESKEAARQAVVFFQKCFEQ